MCQDVTITPGMQSLEHALLDIFNNRILAAHLVFLESVLINFIIKSVRTVSLESSLHCKARLFARNVLLDTSPGTPPEPFANPVTQEKFISSSGSSCCSLCPVGKYSSIERPTSCQSCVEHAETLLGAVSICDCILRRYL